MSTFSEEHQIYLKKKRRERWIVVFFQIFIIVFLLSLWQLCAHFGWINTFLSSSPVEVWKTLWSLASQNGLWDHIWITVYETLLSFSLASLIGFVVATVLWWFPRIAKVMDPYLTILNSLPKVALGPLIIIWVGASTNSIIFMALLISTFVSIINIYNGFLSTDQNYITLLRSFKAKKHQIFLQAVVPSSKENLLNSFKLNISMSLIGVIMGELLVSKKGLGYLIMYGSQVFNINLVITAVFLLGVISYLMYYLISLLEKKLIQKRN